MSIVGYARVSTVGQSLDVQVEKLQPLCDKIFMEKRSGTCDQRSELKACLNYLRGGDTLLITRLDRLARSTLHLTQIADQLRREGIALQVLDQAIDTSTPTGKLLFDVLAAISEFETGIRKERQLEGIAKAKRNGVRFGRKRKLSDDLQVTILQMRQDGHPIGAIMKAHGISRASVYRALKKGGGELM